MEPRRGRGRLKHGKTGKGRCESGPEERQRGGETGGAMGACTGGVAPVLHAPGGRQAGGRDAFHVQIRTREKGKKRKGRVGPKMGARRRIVARWKAQSEGNKNQATPELEGA